MKWIVLVKTRRNGRISDAFAMKNKGIEFFFQNSEGKWINPAVTDGHMKTAFKMLFAEDSMLLSNPRPLMTFVGRKYVVEVREL